MIVDPDQDNIFSDDTTLSKVGWTCYDGRSSKGKILQTMVRGKDVYVDGVVTGQARVGPPGPAILCR